MCLLLTLIVLVIGIIAIAALGEAACRQVPQPYQSWMWVIRILGLIALIVVVASFLFGTGEIHTLRVC